MSSYVLLGGYSTNFLSQVKTDHMRDMSQFAGALG